MIVYSCEILFCPKSIVKTTDRRAIYRHYITHLKDEIDEVALSLGIPIFYENKYSLINSIISHSKTLGGMP